jgi:GT2 family glycosyltransferase
VARVVEPALESSPALSVVIPTHRRLASLLRLLGALDAQDYPRELLEILVIVDGDPATAEALAGRPSLRVLEQPHGGPAAARNLGIAHARGELVLFLDDDVVPAGWCVARHAEAHASRRDLVVIGPLLPPRVGVHVSPWVRWEARTLLRQYSDMEAGRWAATPRQFYTGNASVRREHLIRVGGFDASLHRAEDVELGLRLRDQGLGFEYHPEATAHHEPTRRYRSWVDAAREYGKVDACMALEMGRGEVLEWIASEFHFRHPLTRIAVRAGLRHPCLSSVLPWLALPFAHTALGCGLGRVSDRLCGGVFNVLYWQGVRDGVGGASPVRSLIASRCPGRAASRPEAPKARDRRLPRRRRRRPGESGEIRSDQ